MLSDREKMYRATAIVQRLRSDPHRDNPVQGEFGPDEIAAIEMISLIAGMPETTADKLADTLRAKHDDIAWDLFTGFLEDFWSDEDPTGIGLPPPLKAFFTASRPNVTAPGGVLDREARLLVTEQLIDEFWHRMEVRYRRDFPSGAVSLPPAPPTGPVLRPVRP
jgi:hypothetical protein